MNDDPRNHIVNVLVTGPDDYEAHVPIVCHPKVTECWVGFGGGDSRARVELGLPDAPNAYGSGKFPGAIGLEFPWKKRRAPNANEIAAWIIAAATVAEFHEFAEFTKVDGSRLYDPHDNSDRQWDAQSSDALRMLRRQQRTFPVQP